MPVPTVMRVSDLLSFQLYEGLICVRAESFEAEETMKSMLSKDAEEMTSTPALSDQLRVESR